MACRHTSVCLVFAQQIPKTFERAQVPLVLIFGWWGSKPHHVKKYSDIFAHLDWSITRTWCRGRTAAGGVAAALHLCLITRTWLTPASVCSPSPPAGRHRRHCAVLGTLWWPAIATLVRTYTAEAAAVPGPVAARQDARCRVLLLQRRLPAVRPRAAAAGRRAGVCSHEGTVCVCVRACKACQCVHVCVDWCVWVSVFSENGAIVLAVVGLKAVVWYGLVCLLYFPARHLLCDIRQLPGKWCVLAVRRLVLCQRSPAPRVWVQSSSR